MTTTPYTELSADRPLVSADDDALGRRPFAERIARSLAERKDPESLVIGVYGKWGEGKSTVLNFIEAHLTADEQSKENDGQKIKVIRFNPWLFTSDEELFFAFCIELSRAVEGRSRKGQGKLADFVGKGLVAFGGLAKVIVGSYVGAVADVGGKLLSLVPDQSPTEARREVEQILEEKKVRIVVLIDDLDRLDKDQLQAMFRLLKVAADFKHTSYVVACDHEAVGKMLGERYGSDSAGAEFLEKIVQVPLPLPKPTPKELWQVYHDGIQKVLTDAQVVIDAAEETRLGVTLDGLLQHHLQTSRQVARVSNAIRFGLPMVAKELNPVDWIVLETLRILAPDLHEFIRVEGARVESFLYEGPSHANFSKVRMEKFGPNVADNSAFVFLAKFFPWFGLSRPDDFTTKLAGWRAARRVCSPIYFHRYFAYGPTVYDLPDIDVGRIVKIPRVDDMVRELSLLIERDQNTVLFRKLQVLYCKDNAGTLIEACSILFADADSEAEIIGLVTNVVRAFPRQVKHLMHGDLALRIHVLNGCQDSFADRQFDWVFGATVVSAQEFLSQNDGPGVQAWLYLKFVHDHSDARSLRAWLRGWLAERSIRALHISRFVQNAALKAAADVRSPADLISLVETICGWRLFRQQLRQALNEMDDAGAEWSEQDVANARRLVSYGSEEPT